METAFVMECEEEELEPVQHDDDDDELDDGFLPAQTLQNGSSEELSRRAKLSAMDEFEVALSEEVRKYKHIYNSSLKDHRDSRMVNRSWREISETLSADATYCKKRWQNLRDKFTKARRRMMRSPGGRVNRVPVLYTVLRWLDGHIKPKASMKIFQTETQEQPSPSWQPISRSPSTDIELEMSTINCNTDEFDCAVPDTPSPAPSPVPAPAPSVPVPLPPPTPPPLSPPTPTPTASSRPVPSPLPVPSPTDVPALWPGPFTTSCPGPPAPSSLGPSATSSLGPSANSSLGPSATSSLGLSATSSLGPSATSSLGPSATSSLGPSATSSLGPSATSSLGPSATSSLGPSATSSLDRSAPRSRKRKRASEPEGLNYESLFAALDQRRAAREAAMEAGRERRTAVLERLLGQQDECDRYVLHVADFMRSLPPDHRSEFKFKLQNLMRETEQAVKNGVAENGLAAVQKTEHQNWEER